MHPEENLLDALNKQGANIAYSCRAGQCQACLLQSPGMVNPAWQKGLRQSQIDAGFFYSCQAKVREEGLQVFSGKIFEVQTRAKIVSKKVLADDILLLHVETDKKIPFSAGQFVNLINASGLSRPYSLANTARDNLLEFHIRILPKGKFGQWLTEEAEVGSEIQVGEASGDCTLGPTLSGAMVLIGTGTGLAPLICIAKELLLRNYNEPIYLYHGSRKQSGLYCVEELKALEKNYSNFKYIPCCSGEQAEGIAFGRAHDIAFKEAPLSDDTNLFLCGHPQMVQTSKKKAFLQGLSLSNIKHDAFFNQAS